MKPGFPWLYSKISTIVAVPIIMTTVTFYIIHAINLPANDIYPMALTAFGTTAVLSGVCFAMAPTKTIDPPIRYSGEKFLHSALLILQSVIVVYAKESILSISIIITHYVIRIVISGVFIVVITFVATMAALTWFHGFDELNTELWKKWERRVEIMRKSKEKKTQNLKTITKQSIE
jgi:hypothetical protein